MSTSSSSLTTSNMMELTLIVAATRSMGIGRNGTLPWTGLKKEMAYFARVTKRLPPQAPSTALNAVIMGRKTWESIPEKFRPLKGRLNLVISRSSQPINTTSPPADPARDPVRVSSLEGAMEYLASMTESVGKVFVIGGAQIYNAALKLPATRRILLTRILEPEFECDAIFPLVLGQKQQQQQQQQYKSEDVLGGGSWQEVDKEALDAWTGEVVPAGVQEEAETQYQYEMWEKI